MKEEDEKKRKIIFLFIIILALVAAGIKMYWDDYAISYNPECAIEYGNGECVDGYFRIPFYNPNQQDINRMKITVPFGVTTNITLPADFNVNDPLKPGGTGVLTLFPCEEDFDVRGFSVEWCCGECYKSGMRFPDNKIKIVN